MSRDSAHLGTGDRVTNYGRKFGTKKGAIVTSERRAYVVTPTMTYVDGVALPTPADYARDGLGEFLSRIAGRLGREGCVILNGNAARDLGMPSARDELAEDMREHPAAVAARAAGWKVSTIGDWSTFHREGAAIHVGVTTLLDPEAFPFYGERLADLAHHLYLWHERTGSAYHGTPGAAGLSILSNAYPRKGKGIHPAWKPLRDTAAGKVATGPVGAAEDDYHVDHWRAPRAGTLWAHGYDLNRAYVAAAIAVKVCPWELRRTGRTCEWAPDLAGWWQVELSPWTLRHLPDPAGYDPAGRQDKRVRWVTGPTMGLLAQLAEEGVYAGARVLDSWTGPARELLKPWGTALRQAWDACEDCAEAKNRFVKDDELCSVCQAVKMAGRQSLGLFDRATNWIYRPDWHHAVIAMARANLWRKLWKVGGGVNGNGPWPLWVDVDNIWYGSDIEDPREACPEGLTIGVKLGQVKPKASRRSRKGK